LQTEGQSEARLAALRRWAGRAIYRAPRELLRCPACGSADLAALGTQKLPTAVDGRRTGLISGCESCGLVFVNPFPTAGELATMYGPDGEWAHERTDESLAPPPALDAPPGSGSWPRMFDAIRGDLDVTSPPAGARVLDVGCGRGKFLDVLKPCGWETFGIEPAMEAAFPRHQRLESIPPEPLFDLVVVNHVLEHTTDPLTLLRQLAAATRPGGYLLVGVPRLDTLPRHRDRSYVISRIHVTAYTSTCMIALLRRAGWEPAEEPPDEIPISGGRRTSARLRMVARRVDGSRPGPAQPLGPARAALREYHRQHAPAAVAARLGGARVAARGLETKRRLRKWWQMVGHVAGWRRARTPDR
jgi:SAM-dependent methyltransferase